MATSNNGFSNAPTVTGGTTAQRGPGWFERVRLTAKHMIVIGCLGFLVTVALFVYGGVYVWNNLIVGDDEPVTAQAQAEEAPAVQHNSYSAGQRRDVMANAPAGWVAMPDCASDGKRVYVKRAANGDVTGYFCQ